MYFTLTTRMEIPCFVGNYTEYVFKGLGFEFWDGL